MQFWEKKNNFLTSAFSSPCRVTKEAVSAFGSKTQVAFLTEAFRVLQEESIFITCLILQFARLCKHEVFHSAQSWVLFLQEGLLHRNCVLPTFFVLTEDALIMCSLPIHEIRWKNKNICLQDVFHDGKQSSRLLWMRGFWMSYAGSQSCAGETVCRRQ